MSCLIRSMCLLFSLVLQRLRSVFSRDGERTPINPFVKEDDV